jgi:hypothetical protein
MEQEPIVNRVAQSQLVTLDLEELYDQGERTVLDLKDTLYQGLILREKDFRIWVKEHDWNQYQGMNVAVNCSADAIIPTWAYMLVITKIQPFAKRVMLGSLEALEQSLFQEALANLDIRNYQNAKVVIKGCSKYPVPGFAYAEVTRLLTPVVSSLMYGEPCSTVPIYKKPKTK